MHVCTFTRHSRWKCFEELKHTCLPCSSFSPPPVFHPVHSSGVVVIKLTKVLPSFTLSMSYALSLPLSLLHPLSVSFLCPVMWLTNNLSLFHSSCVSLFTSVSRPPSLFSLSMFSVPVCRVFTTLPSLLISPRSLRPVMQWTIKANRLPHTRLIHMVQWVSDPAQIHTDTTSSDRLSPPHPLAACTPASILTQTKSRGQGWCITDPLTSGNRLLLLPRSTAATRAQYEILYSLCRVLKSGQSFHCCLKIHGKNFSPLC